MINIAEPELGRAERDAVDDVLCSGNLAAGQEVESFEAAFADFADADYAVATSNGTTALHAAFEALDLPAGSRVVTTPFSFVATANAPTFAGLEPVFADVDPETFNLDPDAVEERLRTDDDIEAILAVHLYGLPADMPRLAELADEYDVALVEDAAQAHGAAIDGKAIGSWSDAACYSFYPTKNMTTGEGGIVTSDDRLVADRARQFINHGRDTAGYDHEQIGHNFRMTDLAAAIGRVQLDRLPDYTATRRRNAEALTDALADTNVVTPTVPDGHRHVYHQYTVQTQNRDALHDHLTAHDVGSAVYYPRCIHQQEPYGHTAANFPVAERLSDEVLSLPVHPAVSKCEVDRIADVVRGFEEGA